MNRMIKMVCIISVPICALRAQIPLNPDPIGHLVVSAARDIAFGDVDNDGYLDLVVAQEGSAGNPALNYIFMNHSGVLETLPSWQSADADYSLGCAFGDVDNDGDLDLAIGNYQLAGGRVKLYKNEHGAINTNPTWTADVHGGCWVGFGDVDNDGDLDLAAVDLMGYPCVFYNDNGNFETYPSWEAGDYNIDMSAAWFDVENDGDLDLAVGANTGRPMLRVYYNNNGMLENGASWISQPPDSFQCLGLATGDIANDGWLDIATGSGIMPNQGAPNYIHKNIGGSLELSPSWVSGDVYITFRLQFCDLNGDGYKELGCANYPDMPTVIYYNNNGQLVNIPLWSVDYASNWGLSFGDIDNQGVSYREDSLIGDGTRKLFYVSRSPIHRFQAVKIDGAPVPISDYCYELYSGWISFANAPSSGSVITIEYFYSIDMELAISSGYIFDNYNVGISEAQISNLKSPISNLLVYPNPFSKKTEIRWTSYDLRSTMLKIYDATGRLVKTFNDILCNLNNSVQSVSWDGTDNYGQELPGGIYFMRLKANNFSGTEKIIKIQ